MDSLRLILGIALILISYFIISSDLQLKDNDKNLKIETNYCSNLSKNCQIEETVNKLISSWEKSYDCKVSVKVENYTSSHQNSKLSENLNSAIRANNFNQCEVLIIIYSDAINERKKDIKDRLFLQISLFRGKNKVHEENIEF